VKRIMSIVGVVCVVFMLAGCTPNSAFVRAVDNHTAVILPEYRAYVAADDTLDETSKRIRTESADALEELIDAAKGVQP